MFTANFLHALQYVPCKRLPTCCSLELRCKILPNRNTRFILVVHLILAKSIRVTISISHWRIYLKLSIVGESQFRAIESPLVLILKVALCKVQPRRCTCFCVYRVTSRLFGANRRAVFPRYVVSERR